MKKTLLRILFMAFLLVTTGATPVLAGGPGIPPICYPEPTNCN